MVTTAFCVQQRLRILYVYMYGYMYMCGCVCTTLHESFSSNGECRSSLILDCDHHAIFMRDPLLSASLVPSPCFSLPSPSLSSHTDLALKKKIHAGRVL